MSGPYIWRQYEIPTSADPANNIQHVYPYHYKSENALLNQDRMFAEECYCSVGLFWFYFKMCY